MVIPVLNANRYIYFNFDVLHYFPLEEPQPDVNITVLKFSKISKGGTVHITCHASKPRLLKDPYIRPLPPVVIRIFVDEDQVKSCRGNPVHVCSYRIRKINKKIFAIVCAASNSAGECRYKLILLNNRKETDDKRSL